MSSRPTCLTLTLFFFITQCSYAASNDTKDLLTERWFETEIIIFEHIQSLSANEPERLAINAIRSWPRNIRKNKGSNKKIIPPDRKPLFISNLSHRDQILKDLTTLEEQCWGYPYLPKRDPIRSEFRDLGITKESIDSYNQAATTNKKVNEQLILLQPTNKLGNEAPRSTQANQDLPPQSFKKTNELGISNNFKIIANTGFFESELRRSAFTWLAIEEFVLLDEFNALKRAKGIRPIFHGRWRQPTPKRDKPIQISLTSPNNNSSPTVEDDLFKIEGTVSVTAERYLHLSLILWYHADGLGANPITLPIWKRSPMTSGNYMILSENRRMRSQELHYLDHPKVGALVKINEVSLPRDLEKPYEPTLNKKNSLKI